MANALDSNAFVREHSTSERAFTRTRQLPFKLLVCLLLNQVKGALQRECCDFFEQALDQSPGDAVSGAAVSKARVNLSGNVFRALNTMLTDCLTHSSVGRSQWHGLQVFAVDGSVLNLPDRPELREHFQSGANNTADLPTQARLSVLHDAGSDIIYHGELLPFAFGEGVGAAEHLPHTPPGSVTLYDRGYGAFTLFADHRHHQRDFCARARRGFNGEIDAFFAAGLPSSEITLLPSAQAKMVCAEQGLSDGPIRVRLVRVLLSTGEVEVLITSLLDQSRYPSQSFGALYAMRWSIETGYKFAKSRLQIENFSSLRVGGIYQDVYAKLLAKNLVQVMKLAAQQRLEQSDHQAPGRKHERSVSYTDALHQCKHRMVAMILRPEGLANAVESLLARVEKFTEAVRPDRVSQPRRSSRPPKRFAMNAKATA
ncbi:MAG: IS4 family transposase [Pseudomonadota bacterium]|nr:IS4 family transposase [Pseudomonadota bacterium]